MRATPVPTCWPSSARMTLTVTIPSWSIEYQIVGSKPAGAGAGGDGLAGESHGDAGAGGGDQEAAAG